jgi:NADPH2 dehydrogenase
LSRVSQSFARDTPLHTTIKQRIKYITANMGSATPSSKLFQPLKIGKIELSNRVAMAPLTRFRADDAHVPLPIVKEYYTQRASYPGTLQITEATFISPKAGGYPNVPGIYNDAQIKAWKEVTDSVHKAGGVIYLQLWALGRAANPDVLKAEGQETGVVSSSDVPMADNAPKPRPLTEEEIQEYIKDYAQAAKNAIEAGFDGVEVHGANGYLIDQFTQDTANKRTDRWGGSVENRARFALEVTKAVVAAVGAERTGIRLSPWSVFQGMKMEDPIPQFSYLTRELKKLNLAYLHLVESRIAGNADVETTEKIDPFIDIWANTSPILIAGGFKPDSAKRAVDEEYKDKDVVIVFGRYFISTPDLVFRLERGIPLAQYNRDTFYNAKSPEGYVDYPFGEEWVRENGKGKL